MKIYTLAFILCLFASRPFKAQHSFGFDVEFNRDVFKMYDPGSELGTRQISNRSFGIVYRYLFKNHFGVSTGLRLKDYPESMMLKRFNSLTTSGGNMVIQLPVLLSRDFRVFDFLFISPVAGGTCNYFMFKDPGYSLGYVKAGEDSLFYFSQTANSRQVFFTLNLGVSLEARITSRFSTIAFVQYNFGFVTVSQQLINYRLNALPAIDGIKSGRGSYYTFFGIKVLYHLARNKE